MLQIPENKRLDYVLACLKYAGKVKINKAFIEATGADDGNVSKIFKGTLGISDEVFTAFLQAYPVPPPDWNAKNTNLDLGDVKVTLSDYIELLKEKNKAAENHNEQLQKLIEISLSNINSGVNQAVAGVNNLILQTGSLRTVALKSLSRIEKKGADVLLKEADNIIEENIRASEKQDTKV